MTYARRNDVKSEVALSSLIWALLELESYAVARIVTKDGKDPLLVLLVPHVEPNFECLYDVPLPFAEDIRAYKFPPLDKVMTVTGETLTKHRLLPSDELSEAMSAYVDSMDLSTYQLDDNWYDCTNNSNEHRFSFYSNTVLGNRRRSMHRSMRRTIQPFIE